MLLERRGGRADSIRSERLRVCSSMGPPRRAGQVPTPRSTLLPPLVDLGIRNGRTRAVYTPSTCAFVFGSRKSCWSLTFGSPSGRMGSLATPQGQHQLQETPQDSFLALPGNEFAFDVTSLAGPEYADPGFDWVSLVCLEWLRTSWLMLLWPFSWAGLPWTRLRRWDRFEEGVCRGVWESDHVCCCSCSRGPTATLLLVRVSLLKSWSLGLCCQTWGTARSRPVGPRQLIDPRRQGQLVMGLSLCVGKTMEQ